MAEIERLKEQLTKYEVENTEDVERNYKGRLFKFIFGNPDNKQWALSLYNSLREKNYTNPDDLQFNTLDDVVYMGMKNDISFLISFEMNLWEHQSSFNLNMPMRDFLYAARLYEKYIAASEYYLYSSRIQKIPTPVLICFYNGTRGIGKTGIEIKVTMLNINYGKNKELMDDCVPLKEYAWFVDAVRRIQKEKENLNEADAGNISDQEVSDWKQGGGERYVAY